MRYDQYKLTPDRDYDTHVACRRCGASEHVGDSMAEAVVWAESHELQCTGDDK